MILVTGGNGRIARATTERLLAAGQHVRLLSRRPAELRPPSGVEVVVHDERTAWPDVLDSVRSALLYSDPQGVDPLVDAMRTADLDRVVLLSAAGIEVSSATDDDPMVHMHQAAEDAVRAADLPWVFLRSGPMAANTLGWAESIRTQRRVELPFPDARAALIHEADIADVAACVLLNPEADQQERAYHLTGPDSLNQLDQVQAIGAAIGERVDLKQVTPQQYLEAMRSWVYGFKGDTFIGDLLNDEMIDRLIDRLRGADGKPDPVSPAVAQLTGRPGRSFAQWARDHVEVFR